MQDIVTKYSDYIRYPIKMDVERQKPVETDTADDAKYETVVETETFNSMIPLWQRSKKDITY